MTKTAEIVERLVNAEMPAQQLRLHMGELSAEEMRVARAAISWANRRAADHMESLEAKLEMAREALEKVTWALDENRSGPEHHAISVARTTLAALDEDRRTGE